MNKAELLVLACHESDRRAIRSTHIDLVAYNPEGKATGLTSPGTVTVFVARKGSASLQTLRKAIEKQSHDEVASIGNKLAKDYSHRTQVSPDKAWDMLSRQPVFCEIRYGSRILAKDVFVPDDLDLVALPMPYNGGGLSPDHLTLVEHLQDNATQAYEGFAVRHDPNLNAAELAALELVPIDQFELNLAANGTCCDDVTVVVILALMIACSACARGPEVHLSASEIQQLGPAATARRLLEIRRDAMGHFHT